MNATHSISLVRHHLHPSLRGLIAGMVGLSEEADGAVQRQQPAGSLLPLVLSFGRPLEVVSLSEGLGAGRWYQSFVSGFTPGYATTRFERSQDSVQAYLSPTGASRILGVPGRALAGQVVPVGDLVPQLGDGLSARLEALDTWEDRFALVEEVLVRLLDRHAAPPSWVEWMWGQITTHGGQVRIADLVAQTGWSHRHATTIFAEKVGLSPKRAADIVRFERASKDLGRMSIAAVAARHGYADQSHLNRAFRRHAGEPPSRHQVARRPTPLTALHEGTAPLRSNTD